MPAAIGQFLEIFRTLDSVEAYSGSYEPWLVAISVLIAILAAFVALTVAARIVSADSRRSRWAWAIAGAVSMGGGIWSMHFIGMLAFCCLAGSTTTRWARCSRWFRVFSPVVSPSMSSARPHPT